MGRTAGAVLSVAAAACGAPSFLVLHPDDLYPHYGDWGVAPEPPPTAAYGPPIPEAALPHVGRLRAEGLTFSHVVVTAAKCSPSRYSDLTGRYPSRNAEARAATKGAGVTDVHERSCRLGAADAAATVPRFLGACGGYATALVGKYHLALRGAASNSMAAADYADARAEAAATVGVDVVAGFYAGNLETKAARNPAQDGSTLSHNLEWVVDAGLDFLERAGDAPYYLYWNPTLVHSPKVDALLNPKHAAFGAGGKNTSVRGRDRRSTKRGWLVIG